MSTQYINRKDAFMRTYHHRCVPMLDYLFIPFENGTKPEFTTITLHFIFAVVAIVTTSVLLTNMAALTIHILPFSIAHINRPRLINMDIDPNGPYQHAALPSDGSMSDDDDDVERKVNSVNHTIDQQSFTNNDELLDTNMSNLYTQARASATPLGARAKQRNRDSRPNASKRNRHTSIMPSVPQPKSENSDSGHINMTTSNHIPEVYENYTDNEKALDEFIRLHPMLSLDACSQKSLQLIASLSDDISVPVRNIPSVGRSHDNMFLRPADSRLGERSCCIGERCICRYLAFFRYGNSSDMAFIGREFLLPDENVEFLRTGKLPATVGKCLLCYRYFTTYLYRLARSDPNFVPSKTIPLHAFGNVIGHARGKDVLTHASSVGDDDGYPASVMLSVDNDFCNTDSGRSAMSNFMFCPVVGFHSSHYKYTRNTPTGTSMIIQNFREPGRKIDGFSPAIGFANPSNNTFGSILDDLESSGIIDAIHRMEQWICTSNILGDLAPPRLPEWVYDTCIERTLHLVKKEPSYIIRLVQELRMCTVNLNRKANKMPCVHRRYVYETEQCVDHRVLSATARLVLGEMLEAASRCKALYITPSCLTPTNEQIREEMARLMRDSYLISEWTSSYAQYIYFAQCTYPPAISEEDVNGEKNDMQPPSPHFVPWSAGGLIDLSQLVDWKDGMGREQLHSKLNRNQQSRLMESLLTRCTNAGARGWDAVITEAMENNGACLRIFQLILTTVFTGMHSSIHPSLRPSWNVRISIAHATSMVDCNKAFKENSTASKEAFRMYLSILLSNMPATREALRAAGHPAGGLALTPFDCPPPSMQAISSLFVRCGHHMYTKLSECMYNTDSSANLPPIARFMTQEITVALNNAFSSSTVKRQRRGTGKYTRKNIQYHEVIYTHTWLGRSHPLSIKGQTLIDVVNALVFRAFRYDFVPIWIYLFKTNNRLSRLDPAQHAVIHGQNYANILCNSLTQAERLNILHSVLSCPESDLFSVRQAAEFLSLELPKPNIRGRVNLCDFTGHSAAMLIFMARVSAMKSKIIIYDLGKRIYSMQVRALAKRLLIDVGSEDTVKDVDSRIHRDCKSILLCVECGRIANAVQCCPEKRGTFDEIGFAASMLRVDGKLCDGHMRCAKRSSATLRVAMKLEEDASKVLNNIDNENFTTIHTATSDNIMSKLRRDQKSVFDQIGATTACGDQPLVSMPILGKAINVFGQCYSLCPFCGCTFIVTPSARYTGDICCGKCDHDMLSRHESRQTQKHSVKTKLAVYRTCRFCGRVDNVPEEHSKWQNVYAPLDDTGDNASVPPPLRYVHYCPTHFRPWVIQSHLMLTTPQIFAHITHKVKPVIEADKNYLASSKGNDVDKDNTKQPTNPPTRRKRFKNIKHKQLSKRLKT